VAIIEFTIPKVVILLQTTRSENVLRNRMTNQVWPDLRDAAVDALNADAQTSHVSHVFRVMVKVRADGSAEVYPKMQATIDTTRTRQQLLNGLDSLLDEWKTIVRGHVASDAQTTITGWHRHLVAGPVDEGEP
jgi:hypothetical protein